MHFNLFNFNLIYFICILHAIKHLFALIISHKPVFSCQFKHASALSKCCIVIYRDVVLGMCRYISVHVKQKGSGSLYVWQSVLFTRTSLSPLAFVKRSDSVKARPSCIIEESRAVTHSLSFIIWAQLKHESDPNTAALCWFILMSRKLSYVDFPISDHQLMQHKSLPYKTRTYVGQSCISRKV